MGFTARICSTNVCTLATQLFIVETELAHPSVDVAALVGAIFDLAGFEFANARRHIGTGRDHGARFGCRHEAARPQHLAEATDHAHHVLRCQGHVEIEPAALDFLDKIVAAREIGAGFFGFGDVIALTKHHDPDYLANAVRQGHAAAYHLIVLRRVDSKGHMNFDGFIELRPLG